MKRKASVLNVLSSVSKRRKLSKMRTRTIPKSLRGFARIGGYYKRYTSTSEVKFYDSTITAYSIDATGEVVPISTGSSGSGSTGTILQIPQGDREFERNGRKVVLTNLSYQGIINHTINSTFGTLIQLCLVYDRQCNGSLPAYTEIFQTNNINSFNNLSNSSRFKILKKIRFTSNPNSILSNTDVLPKVYNIKGNIKLNMPIEYDNSATTGVITSIKSNNLFWVAISSPLDDGVVLSLNTRVRFKDN